MNSNMLNVNHLIYETHWLVGIFLMVLLSMPIVTWAHSNEYLSKIKGAHGGMLRMADMYHFELVVKDGEARVWVTDHGDTPQATRGAIGTLRIISSNNTFLVHLVPVGRNELLIKDARIKARKETRFLLDIKMKGEPNLSARFSM